MYSVRFGAGCALLFIVGGVFFNLITALPLDMPVRHDEGKKGAMRSPFKMIIGSGNSSAFVSKAKTFPISLIHGLRKVRSCDKIADSK